MLYLSDAHVAFARDGAAGGGLVGGGSGSAAVPPPPEAGLAGQAGMPLTLIPLASIRRCVRARRHRSRGLALFVAGESEPALFWGFEARSKGGGGGWWGGGGGNGSGGGDAAGLEALATAAGGDAAASAAGDGSRDAAEAALRLHVMGDGSELDRSLRGLPPSDAAPGTPADRAWEVRLVGGGGGWGGAGGAWGALLAGPDGALFLSDESPPLYARYATLTDARPASTARDWQLSADVTVAGRWAPLPPGAAAAAAAGGGSLPPPGGQPPPSVSKLHFAGLGGDGVAELVAELGARMADAKMAEAGAVVLQAG